MRKSIPIFYSALLLTAVNLLLRFVSTSFQVFISTRIGAEGVGLLQLVLSIASLSTTVGMAGIRTATMYLTAEELGRNQQKNTAYILRGCLLYSLLFSGTVSVVVQLIAPYLSDNWIGIPETEGAIRIFAFFLPVVCATGCMTGYFTASNRIIPLAAIEIAEQFCYMTVTMLTLSFWAGTVPEKACEAIVFGSGTSSLFTLILLSFLWYRSKSPVGKPIPVAKRIAQSALPLALADNLKVGISTAENLMVPKRLALYPAQTSPLAAFGTVVGMVFPVMMFPAAILYALAELLIPELALCNASDRRLRIRYLIRRGMRVALLFGCFCGGIMFLSADELCQALYHNYNAGSHLRMYSLLIPMLYCDIITDAMTKGLGQQRVCVRYNIITSAMDIILLFFLLPVFGMTGYFYSFLITHAINFLLSLSRLIKISGIKFPFYPAALSCTSLIVATYIASNLESIALRIPAFITILLCLLVLFQIVSWKDIRWIKGLLTRK